MNSFLQNEKQVVSRTGNNGFLDPKLLSWLRHVTPGALTGKTQILVV